MDQRVTYRLDLERYPNTLYHHDWVPQDSTFNARSDEGVYRGYAYQLYRNDWGIYCADVEPPAEYDFSAFREELEQVIPESRGFIGQWAWDYGHGHHYIPRLEKQHGDDCLYWNHEMVFAEICKVIDKMHELQEKSLTKHWGGGNLGLAVIQSGIEDIRLQINGVQDERYHCCA